MFKLLIRINLSLIIALGLASAVPAQTLPKPIILTYGGPMPQGVRITYENRDSALDVANVIEMGPNAATYSKPFRFQPQLLNHWKDQGKILVRRVFLTTRLEGKAPLPATIAELAERWADALNEAYVDGIAIDELVSQEGVDLNVFVATLQETRKRFPNKLIFCWVGGTKVPAKPLQAVRDLADYVIPEIYYKESDAKSYPNYSFPRFREVMHWLETSAPGILKKTIIGIGVHEKLYNDDPTIDYRDFLEAQIRTVRTDPLLKTLPGLAIYAPNYASAETLKHLDRVIRKYYFP